MRIKIKSKEALLNSYDIKYNQDSKSYQYKNTNMVFYEQELGKEFNATDEENISLPCTCGCNTMFNIPVCSVFIQEIIHER